MATMPSAQDAIEATQPTRQAAGPGSGVRLGLRANLAQFSLLVAVNALVGGVLGQERVVVPLLAHQVFGLAAFTSALTFILAFGAVKAVTNFFAGALSDQYGRKPVLIAGWLAALPVPAMLIWAPSWGWVVAANVLLGINQGLTWSTTVIMKIDLVGPNRRGLAMGLNEAAGYGALSVTTWPPRTGCAQPRSCSAPPTSPWAWDCPPSPYGKRMRTPASRPPTTPRARASCIST
jgi:MFS family permease